MIASLGILFGAQQGHAFDVGGADDRFEEFEISGICPKRLEVTGSSGDAFVALAYNDTIYFAGGSRFSKGAISNIDDDGTPYPEISATIIAN